MIVDDEIEITKALAKILESEDFKVEEFVDSREALKAFQESPDKFDIIITDLVMPHMDGAELRNKIRSLDPEIPILFCSGWVANSNELELLPGIEAFCQKPVKLITLLETIEELLKTLEE